MYIYLSSFSGGLLQCLGCLSTVTSFKQIEAQETGSGSETFSENDFLREKNNHTQTCQKDKQDKGKCSNMVPCVFRKQ